MFEKTKQDFINDTQAEYPEVGDFWHETFAPCLVVVGVLQHNVIVCEKTRPVENTKWTWDLDELKIYSKEEFKKKFYYLGDSRLHDKCWCDVIPKGHEWVKNYV